MTANEFLSLRLTNGAPVRVRFGAPGGETRTVRLFFRGFAIRGGASVAHSTDNLVPLFSAPNGRGGVNRRYYSASDTSFNNIQQLEIL